LCVWQAIHLNVPPPGEPRYKQLLRRAGWSILAIVAPELVALNAWLQHRRANGLMKEINHLRGLDPPDPVRRNLKLHLRFRDFVRRSYRYISTYMGKALFAMLSIPDWLRMNIRHRDTMRATELEHVARQHAQMDKGTLPWTVDIAFYAISGAIVLKDDHEMNLAIGELEFKYLAEYDPKALVSVQRAALQDPGKASGLAKMITCTQAFWFCPQCIARLSQDMAISLIELNTFAHCISAFFIYAFWWHKPYDVEAHVYIDQSELLQRHLLWEIKKGTRQIVNTVGLGPLNWDNGYDVFEKSPDGRVSTVATSVIIHSNSEEAILHKYHHRIKYGAAIPGTGLTLLRSDAAHRGPDLLLSDKALASLKRLWHVRCDIRRKNEFYHETIAASHSSVRGRASNLDSSLADYTEAIIDNDTAITILALTLTFLAYGSLHLLAWQYNFQTNAEGIMWKIASVTTASSGMIFVLLQWTSSVEDFHWIVFGTLVAVVVLILVLIFEFLARSFLVIESFRALPNSPSSVYEIPRWIAYLPHI